MVTMTLWVGRLAAGYVLLAGGFSIYIYSQSADGRKAVADMRAAQPQIAAAVDTAVIEGQAALDRMLQSAMMAPGETGTDATAAGPHTEANPTAELQFRVVSASPAAPPTAQAVSPDAMTAPAQAAAQSVADAHAPLTHAAQTAAELPEKAAAETKPLIAALPAPPSAAQPASAASGQKLADGTRDSTPPDPVEQRIKARIPQEMQEFFDLYLYVSKADKGSWAQRMYVMAKQPDNTYAQLHNWVVSTGKEEMMRNPHGVVMNTDTPEGFFRLDRGRFFEDYSSYQWKAPMPHAMFFDWQIEGRRSGLAIHGTGPMEDVDLGRRASKGCIRLSPENAEKLFKLITENYAGRVPQLKIDPATGTQSTNGLMRRDDKGRILTKRGYRVLVVIENYGGPATETIATIM